MTRAIADVLKEVEERMRNAALDEARNATASELQELRERLSRQERKLEESRTTHAGELQELQDQLRRQAGQLTKQERDHAELREKLATNERELVTLKADNSRLSREVNDLKQQQRPQANPTNPSASSGTSASIANHQLSCASDASVGFFWFDFDEMLAKYDGLPQSGREIGSWSHNQNKIIAGIPLKANIQIKSIDRTDYLGPFCGGSADLLNCSQVPWPVRRIIRLTVIDRDGKPFKTMQIKTTPYEGIDNACFENPAAATIRVGFPQFLPLADLQRESDRLLVKGKLCVSLTVEPLDEE